MAEAAVVVATAEAPGGGGGGGGGAEEWMRRRPGRLSASGTHYLLTGPAHSTKLVVCIPGIGGIHIYYDELEKALTQHGYRVLRYDLMGRGWSEPAPGHYHSKPPGCCGGCAPLEEDPYGLDAHVAQLHTLLTELDLIKEGGAEPSPRAAAADDDRLGVSMSGSRRRMSGGGGGGFRGQPLDLDASVSSCSSATTATTAAGGPLDASTASTASGMVTQTWPPQVPSPRMAGAAAAAASLSTNHQASSSSRDATATAAAKKAEQGGSGGLASVPEAEAVVVPPTAHIKVRQVHLIGHSMGGAIACGFADAYPDLVASLTLLTPAGLMDPGQLRLLRSIPCCIQNLVKAGMRRHVDNAIKNDFLVHDSPLVERVLGQVRAHLAHNPTAHDAFFRCILAFPLSGLDNVVQRVAATRVPTLLVWALYDRVLPFEPHYARWKALLKTGQNVRYEVIEDGCHGFPLERPERTNQIVLRFLAKPPTFLPPAVLHSLTSHPPTITI